VATKGADEAAGSKRRERSMKGSMERASPHMVDLLSHEGTISVPPLAQGGNVRLKLITINIRVVVSVRRDTPESTLHD